VPDTEQRLLARRYGVLASLTVRHTACSGYPCRMRSENPWPGKTQLLSVVVPVFNEEQNVPQFLRVLTPILENTGLDFEIIFALDPPPNPTQEFILKHREQNLRINLLTSSRRVAHPMATLGGPKFPRGDPVVPINFDFQ